MRNRSPTGGLAPLESVVDVLINQSRRISFLITLAYVSAIAGLVLSIVSDVGSPTSKYATAGIALMGISFVSLFVVSVMILDLTPGPRR